MRVRNKTSNFIQLAGTQPGWYYNFGPFEEKEVDDGLLGQITGNSGFEIIPEPNVVIVKTVEISTPEVTVTKMAIVEPMGVTVSENTSQTVPERMIVEPEMKEKVSTITGDRTITCDVCGKVIKSKNDKFDKRIIAMHKARTHKSV